MTPVMIHADGTDCEHDGPAQRTVDDEGGPACSAGLEITHVRFHDHVSTIGDAHYAFLAMAKAITDALTPLVTAYAEFARRLSENPHIRALAAAAAVIDEERANELS